MAEVRFYCDSHANIHSCHKSKVLDTVSDLGLEEGEWEEMHEEARYEIVRDWAEQRWSYGYEEV